MKRIVIIAAAACALAGCRGEGDAWQFTLLPTRDYQAAFQAAHEVLLQEYVVERASFVEGKIETRPLAVRKTGKERKLGAYVSSGAVQNYRRIVTCWLDRDSSGVRVRVSAMLQRESTSQAETLLVAQEGGDSHQAGAERQWRHLGEQRSSYWADAGRDLEAERELLRRIAERAAGAGVKEGAEGGGTSAEQLRREAMSH